MLVIGVQEEMKVKKQGGMNEVEEESARKSDAAFYMRWISVWPPLSYYIVHPPSSRPGSIEFMSLFESNQHASHHWRGATEFEVFNRCNPALSCFTETLFLTSFVQSRISLLPTPPHQQKRGEPKGKWPPIKDKEHRTNMQRKQQKKHQRHARTCIQPIIPEVGGRAGVTLHHGRHWRLEGKPPEPCHPSLLHLLWRVPPARGPKHWRPPCPCRHRPS